MLEINTNQIAVGAGEAGEQDSSSGDDEVIQITEQNDTIQNTVQAEEDASDDQEDVGESISSSQPGKEKEVDDSSVNSVRDTEITIELRYCSICNLEIPLRAKHCRDCGK
jgi:hypothetical protein